MEKKPSTSFLFDEILTCGAVLSGFELCEAIRELGHECYIVSKYRNEELEKYFKISPIREPKGTTITFCPKIHGEYAYIRTKDGRWLNHEGKKIAVSQWIADWIKADVIIGNGTHRRFSNQNIKRDIDILIEGNYEYNKNIEETIKEARTRTSGVIAWMGRETSEQFDNVITFQNPPLDEIPKIYNRSKIFLKMSKEEGWGRPIAEAIACGCEVINKSGGNKEIEIVPWEKIAKQLLSYLDGH